MGDRRYYLWNFICQDINPNGSSFTPIFLSSSGASRRYVDNSIDFNNKLYFAADDGENGNELWVSDGTADGTLLDADVAPGTFEDYYGDIQPSSSDIQYFGIYNGKLYFSAFEDEVWVSDGTAEGTQLVANIGANTSNSNPGLFTEFNDKLYFVANDGENGDELWVSDGTSEGTELAVDIAPGGASSTPSNLIEFNDKLYFTAFRDELWVSDGTFEGTEKATDINIGASDGLAEFNGKLYFSAFQEDTGRELWATDGTTEGTQLVADINPGTNSSLPYGFTEFNGKLYFAALKEGIGFELWSTDGTTEGTVLVEDLNPGNGFAFDIGYDSTENSFAALGDELLFNGNNGETGEELYKLTFDGTVDPGEPNTINGSDGSDNLTGTDGVDVINGLGGADTLSGGDDNDTLLGGGGNDSLVGGNGDDILAGEQADDTIDGGVGNDTLSGGNGTDLFVLGSNNGEDTITDFNPGQDSFKLLNGLSFGDLTLTGNQIQVGDSLLATVEGVNTSSLSASNFDESEPGNPGGSGKIEGTLNADTIDGTDSADRIKGLAGNDVINALGGDDTVFGDVGNDVLDSGDGNDIIYGGSC